MTNDRRIALGLFALTFVTYAYFFNGGGWNQNAYFDLTRALVERHTLWIDGYHTNTGDVVVVRGHAYINKPPGLSVAAAIPYAALYTTLGPPRGTMEMTLYAYLCTVLTCGLAGAFVPAVFFLYARRKLQIDCHWAVGIALILALATPLFAYSTMLYLHVPSALLTLLCFVYSSDERPFTAGLAAGFHGLLNYVAIPLVIVFGLRLAPRRWWLYALGTVPGFALLAAYQISAFGAVFRNPATMNPAFTRESGDVLGMPSLRALLGITISPYRGLFYVAPVLVFAIAGIIVMFRRRELADAITVCAVAALFLAVNAGFNNWNAGSAYAPRYLLPMVPVLGIAMLRVARWWTPLWLVLAAISFANSFAATTVDPQVPITVENPLLHYIYPLLIWGSLAPEVPVHPAWLSAFLTGHVSVNRQTVNEILPLIRHAPASHDAEWASFNAGELIFGAGSAWSLLPFLVGILVAAVLLIRARSTQTHGR